DAKQVRSGPHGHCRDSFGSCRVSVLRRLFVLSYRGKTRCRNCERDGTLARRGSVLMPPGNGSRPSSRAYSGEGVPVGWRMSGDQKPSRLSGTTGAPASLQRTQAPAIVVRQNNRPVFSQVIGQNTMQENKTVE